MTAEPLASPLPLPISVLPRLATPRDVDAPTSDLGRFVAHVHGRPWLPWQTLTGAVLGETTADGRMRYPIAVVMVPRQCGKSTWVFDDVLGRCIEYPDYHAAYTAQTGAAASERFGERMSQLAATPLAEYIKSRRSAGTERMTVQAKPGAPASYVKAFPPRDGALRGSALDLVLIDEAQEIDELLGVALDQTILPTFTTRPRRQLVLIGTAGNEESAFMARYLALARGGAEGVAVIEYGATEEDDPMDPAVWWRVHPGLAAGLTDEAALRSALQVMGAENFAREYLNVWADSGRRLVTAKSWNRCRRVKAVPRPGVAPVFGVDVAYDRSAAVIVACWPDRDGVPMVEIVEYSPGVDWAAARLDELRRTHRPPLIVADSQGPVVTVVDAARRLGVAVKSVTPTELATACQSTFDAIETATIGHRSEQPLNAAVQGAGKRPIGDGGWAWGRRTSTVDIAPLMGASLAYWGNQRRPARPQVDT